MKVLYCAHCAKTFFIVSHRDRFTCKICTGPLEELPVSFTDFIELGLPEREAYIKDWLQHRANKETFKVM